MVIITLTVFLLKESSKIVEIVFSRHLKIIRELNRLDNSMRRRCKTCFLPIWNPSWVNWFGNRSLSVRMVNILLSSIRRWPFLRWFGRLLLASCAMVLDIHLSLRSSDMARLDLVLGTSAIPSDKSAKFLLISRSVWGEVVADNVGSDFGWQNLRQTRAKYCMLTRAARRFSGLTLSGCVELQSQKDSGSWPIPGLIPWIIPGVWRKGLLFILTALPWSLKAEV